jgi:hypothetical protein
MSLTSIGVARSCIPGCLGIAFLITATAFSFGQDLKAASTLGFSVRVVAPGTAHFLSPRVTEVPPDGYSSSVMIPLGTESSRADNKSAMQVIARFRGENGNNSSELSARIGRGELQKFVLAETKNFSVLAIPKERLAVGTSDRGRILELKWSTTISDPVSNVLEIELRQY